MDSGYLQEPIGSGRVRFTIVPARAARPRAWPLALGAATVLPVAGSAGLNAGLGAIALRGAIAAALGLLVYRVARRWLAARAEQARHPGGTFVVAPDGIESGDARIAREHLARLSVTNPRRDGGARVSYMLCAESDGRSIALAGGMTEPIAQGLLTDVGRILFPRAEDSAPRSRP
jgi:hypothetical protein